MNRRSHTSFSVAAWCRAVAFVAIANLAVACGASGDSSNSPSTTTPRSAAESPSSPSPASDELAGVVAIDGGRGLYVRCTGSGSPTVVMEGGDGDDSGSYSFAESTIAELTRTCVYDRANLGQSDPAPGPRGLPELVSDLEKLLEAADISPPYVLVGTSGGGFIAAGYAVSHPNQIAGMVFIDTGAPFRNPPREIVRETAWDSPENIEQRDYLQVEKDAWAARKRIGDIPVTIVSVEFSAEEVEASPFRSERIAMQRNVQNQRGWLVLSPRAEQIVVRTGHAVEEEDPDLVIEVIRDVVEAAR